MKKRILSLIVVLALMIASVSVTAAIQNKKLAELESGYETRLENAQAEAEALQSQLELLQEEREKIGELITGLIGRVDYRDETVYVIGHRTPDCDTASSAIGMAYLLNSLGIAAEARITGDLNLETEYAFSELGVPVPEILEDAAGKQLWLVDHSVYAQMVNGAEDARIVGLVDHHGIGNAENTEPICILSCPAGSTCSIVYSLCDLCGVELPQDVAAALLTGILSDTDNRKSRNTTPLDDAALEELKLLAGVEDTDALFDGMLEAKLSFKGMSDRDIFYSDYKDYDQNGYSYGIGCVKVARADLEPDMAERMQKVILEEMENGCRAEFLLFSVYNSDYSMGYMGCCGKDPEFAEKLMESVFGDLPEREGDFYVFRPSLARKTEIVPPIDDYLDALQ